LTISSILIKVNIFIHQIQVVPLGKIFAENPFYLLVARH